MKRNLFALVLLTLSVFCFAQNTPAPSQSRVLLSGVPKYALIEAKAGRSFLKQMEPSFDQPSNVFYGSAGVCVGVLWNRNLIGIGTNVEYIDLLDSSVSVPLFAQLRHYVFSDNAQGFYLDVRAGWIFGGKKSFATLKYLPNSFILQGTTLRSVAGPYGEVLLGFSYQRFDFFVSYNYRIIDYDSKFIYYYAPSSAPNYDGEWKKTMHTVMGGVGFRLF